MEKLAGAIMFAGFLLTFGAVGGIETAGPEESLWVGFGFAALGLGLMYVGVTLLKAVDR